MVNWTRTRETVSITAGRWVGACCLATFIASILYFLPAAVRLAIRLLAGPVIAGSVAFASVPALPVMHSSAIS